MTTTTAPTSLARQFAAEYAKGIVPANLKAIANSKRFNVAIIALVMAITYPHVAIYLWNTDRFWWFAWIIPLVFDLSILADVSTIQTPGMRRQAKRRAMVTLAMAGVASAALNIAASVDLLSAAVFAALVVVMIARKWASAPIGPDFAEIEAQETAAVAQAAPEPVAEVKRCAEDCTCKRHPRNRIAKAKPVKVPAPRKPRRSKADAEHAKFEAELLDMIRDESVRPVSPAPIGS